MPILTLIALQGAILGNYYRVYGWGLVSNPKPPPGGWWSQTQPVRCRSGAETGSGGRPKRASGGVRYAHSHPYVLAGPILSNYYRVYGWGLASNSNRGSGLRGLLSGGPVRVLKGP